MQAVLRSIDAKLLNNSDCLPDFRVIEGPRSICGNKSRVHGHS
jgi:hypothetical protein